MKNLTSSRATSCLPEGLGRHPDGSLRPELLLLSALDQIGAHLLQGLDVPRGQGDADTVDGGFLAAGGLGVLVSRLKQDRLLHSNVS